MLEEILTRGDKDVAKVVIKYRGQDFAEKYANLVTDLIARKHNDTELKLVGIDNLLKSMNDSGVKLVRIDNLLRLMNVTEFKNNIQKMYDDYYEYHRTDLSEKHVFSSIDTCKILGEIESWSKNQHPNQWNNYPYFVGASEIIRDLKNRGMKVKPRTDTLGFPFVGSMCIKTLRSS